LHINLVQKYSINLNIKHPAHQESLFPPEQKKGKVSIQAFWCSSEAKPVFLFDTSAIKIAKII
jgi:hypothetical protein